MKRDVIGVISAVMGAVVGGIVVGVLVRDEAEKATKLSDKHFALFMMVNQWLRIKLEGKKLETYFNECGYHRIAIYGMSYTGENLVKELQDTNIEVVYGIDRNAPNLYSNVKICSLDDSLENVDAIVVTPITLFDEIEKELLKKVTCPILSLNDILYEI